MKTQFTILAFIIGISLTNAQETEKSIQKNQFNFMKNFNSANENIDYTFGYQRNLNEDVSIGFNLNYFNIKGQVYEQYNNSYYVSNKMNFNSIGVAATFNYDWSRIIGMNTKKFDLYTGTSIGISVLDKYSLDRSPTNGLPTIFSKYTTNELVFGGQIGFRYWITKNIGISTEINKSFYDTNNQQNTKLSFGLNYKF